MQPDWLQGMEPVEFPAETAIGSMARYITTANPNNFQPMNANFGLFPNCLKKLKGSRKETYSMQTEH